MSFADGDALGASMVNVLVQNQVWLREVTEPVAMPKVREYQKGTGKGTGGTEFYFVLVHGGKSDNLRFHGSLTADEGPATLSLYYKDMDTPLWQETCNSGTKNIVRMDSIASWPSPSTHPDSGSVVRVKLTVTGNGTPSFTVHYLREQVPPASIQYAAPPAFTDGTLAKARDLNRLVRNDVELSALASPVMGFREVELYNNKGDCSAAIKFFLRHGGDSDKLRVIGWYFYDPETPPGTHANLRLYLNEVGSSVIMTIPDDLPGGHPKKYTKQKWFDIAKPLPSGHGEAGNEITIVIYKDPSATYRGNLSVHFLYMGEER